MPALYKFLGNPAIAHSVLAGSIKFTPIAELNDPAELNPTLNREAVMASLSRLREIGYSQDDLIYLRRQEAVLQALSPSAQAVHVPSTPEEATRIIQSPFYDSTSTLERLLSKTARDIASNVGLFCLSRRFDSLPMWAHYAANATGFAVEFTDLESEFTGDATGVLRQLREVTYAQEIEGVTFDPKSHESLFFSKYMDWSYEQEARVVLPLADCRQHIHDQSILYLYDLPTKFIRRVILGWNINRTSVDVVRDAVSEFCPNAEVVQAKFLRGKVSLVNRDGIA
ncbi:DUF2971 domain-containing protein [Rivihabitans pingtungensis]|jgi:hypothetical protein|uniref:DUF2971 domain-containing protein n=1 Tax=Rivihabitans pingtungensis TaxID=1054498 RepID=UPI002FD899E8